jgi:dihydroneopterin aldolase
VLVLPIRSGEPVLPLRASALVLRLRAGALVLLNRAGDPVLLNRAGELVLRLRSGELETASLESAFVEPAFKEAGVIGTVHIRSVEFQGRHGASADERRSSRRFQVDVDLTFPMERAMESDRLSDTVNYRDVCEIVVAIGEARPFRLLEALAAEMLRELKKRWPDADIAIELRKLHPPCPGNPQFTSVRLRG